MRKEVRIAGFGGQGVITIGVLAAIAVGQFGGTHVAQTQSYGPEARGGACKTDVVFSDAPIDYIKPLNLDAMVVMSQAALDRYATGLSDDGMLLVDSTLVHMVPERFIRVSRIPATEAVESLGLKVAANVCMFGALASLTGWLTPESCKSALAAQLSAGILAKNNEAFDTGFAYFHRLK